VTNQREKRRNKRDMLNAFIKELSKQKGVISEFDEQLWYALIDKVTVYGEEDIRFKFKDGAVIRM
jgi:site-specific DNA recombinase